MSRLNATLTELSAFVFPTTKQNRQPGFISRDENVQILMQHMEGIQKSRQKEECIWLLRECLFWIHAQREGKMAKTKLCFTEMEEEKKDKESRGTKGGR